MMHSERAAGPVSAEARPLFFVAFGPAMITALTVAVISLAILLVEGGSLGAAFATVSALWLAVHQVPITVSDITVSVLPLVPTVMLVAGVARTTRRAATVDRTVVELRNIALCAVAGPLLFTAIALAVMSDAAGEYTVGVPPPFAAFAWTLGVHLTGTVIGFAPVYGGGLMDLARIPYWVRDCARVAGRALVVFFAVGAVLVLVRLAWQWQAVTDLINSGNDPLGMTALVILSLAYLPNVALIASALPVGAGAQVGGATVGLFSASPGTVSLPSVPVLAVMPGGGDVPVYLLALLVVPVLVAIRAGRQCAAFDPDLGPTVRNVGTTALITAAGLAGGAALGGGWLGGLGYTGADLPALAGFGFAAMALIGVLTAILAQQFGDIRYVRGLRREAVAETGGYTTFADEADEPTAELPGDATRERAGDGADGDGAGGDDADRDGPDADGPDADGAGYGAADGDGSDGDGSGGARAAGGDAAGEAGDDAPETGDFDSVPTERVSTHPRRPRKPTNSQRERDIADIEDLDSYTFDR